MTNLHKANRRKNDVYEYLEERYGREDPRSSGYRSVRSFEFESAVIRNLLRDSNGWILDLACGHGLITEPLVAEGRCVFGIDSNQNAACSAARRKLISVSGDAFSMPFRESSFDVVLSTEFIQQYSPDQTKKLLREMVRVSRPNGILILIWRQGASLMRRLITNSLRIVDWWQGRPNLKLFDHPFELVCSWAVSHQLEIIGSLSVCPLLGLTIRDAKSLSSRIFGTSYIAVMQRRP
jgi:ubiquinone/menaquinone biosynthesis C-methylase UbiE